MSRKRSASGMSGLLDNIATFAGLGPEVEPTKIRELYLRRSITLMKSIMLVINDNWRMDFKNLTWHFRESRDTIRLNPETDKRVVRANLQTPELLTRTIYQLGMDKAAYDKTPVVPNFDDLFLFKYFRHANIKDRVFFLQKYANQETKITANPPYVNKRMAIECVLAEILRISLIPENPVELNSIVDDENKYPIIIEFLDDVKEQIRKTYPEVLELLTIDEHTNVLRIKQRYDVSGRDRSVLDELKTLRLDIVRMEEEIQQQGTPEEIAHLPKRRQNTYFRRELNDPVAPVQPGSAVLPPPEVVSPDLLSTLVQPESLDERIDRRIKMSSMTLLELVLIAKIDMRDNAQAMKEVESLRKAMIIDMKTHTKSKIQQRFASNQTVTERDIKDEMDRYGDVINYPTVIKDMEFINRLVDLARKDVSRVFVFFGIPVPEVLKVDRIVYPLGGTVAIHFKYQAGRSQLLIEEIHNVVVDINSDEVSNILPQQDTTGMMCLQSVDAQLLVIDSSPERTIETGGDYIFNMKKDGSFYDVTDTTKIIHPWSNIEDGRLLPYDDQSMWRPSPRGYKQYMDVYSGYGSQLGLLEYMFRYFQLDKLSKKVDMRMDYAYPAYTNDNTGINNMARVLPLIKSNNEQIGYLLRTFKRVPGETLTHKKRFVDNNGVFKFELHRLTGFDARFTRIITGYINYNDAMDALYYYYRVAALGNEFKRDTPSKALRFVCAVNAIHLQYALVRLISRILRNGNVDVDPLHRSDRYEIPTSDFNHPQYVWDHMVIMLEQNFKSITDAQEEIDAKWSGQFKDRIGAMVDMASYNPLGTLIATVGAAAAFKQVYALVSSSSSIMVLGINALTLTSLFGIVLICKDIVDRAFKKFSSADHYRMWSKISSFMTTVVFKEAIYLISKPSTGPDGGFSDYDMASVRYRCGQAFIYIVQIVIGQYMVRNFVPRILTDLLGKIPEWIGGVLGFVQKTVVDAIGAIVTNMPILQNNIYVNGFFGDIFATIEEDSEMIGSTAVFAVFTSLAISGTNWVYGAYVSDRLPAYASPFTEIEIDTSTFRHKAPVLANWLRSFEMDVKDSNPNGYDTNGYLLIPNSILALARKIYPSLHVPGMQYVYENYLGIPNAFFLYNTMRFGPFINLCMQYARQFMGLAGYTLPIAKVIKTLSPTFVRYGKDETWLKGVEQAVPGYTKITMDVPFEYKGNPFTAHVNISKLQNDAIERAVENLGGRKGNDNFMNEDQKGLLLYNLHYAGTFSKELGVTTLASPKDISLENIKKLTGLVANPNPIYKYASTNSTTHMLVRAQNEFYLSASFLAECMDVKAWEALWGAGATNMDNILNITGNHPPTAKDAIPLIVEAINNPLYIKNNPIAKFIKRYGIFGPLKPGDIIDTSPPRTFGTMTNIETIFTVVNVTATEVQKYMNSELTKGLIQNIFGQDPEAQIQSFVGYLVGGVVLTALYAGFSLVSRAYSAVTGVATGFTSIFFGKSKNVNQGRTGAPQRDISSGPTLVLPLPQPEVVTESSMASVLDILLEYGTISNYNDLSDERAFELTTLMCQPFSDPIFCSMLQELYQPVGSFHIWGPENKQFPLTPDQQRSINENLPQRLSVAAAVSPSASALANPISKSYTLNLGMDEYDTFYDTMAGVYNSLRDESDDFISVFRPLADKEDNPNQFRGQIMSFVNIFLFIDNIIANYKNKTK